MLRFLRASVERLLGLALVVNAGINHAALVLAGTRLSESYLPFWLKLETFFLLFNFNWATGKTSSSLLNFSEVLIQFHVLCGNYLLLLEGLGVVFAADQGREILHLLVLVRDCL